MLPAWPFWLLFLAVGVAALVSAKRLDDAERVRWAAEKKRRNARTTSGQT